MVHKSAAVLRKLAKGEGVTEEQQLSALREDGTVGQFWQSLDDETASELIDALNSMTPEELAATLMLARMPQTVPQEEELPADGEETELIEAIDAISRDDTQAEVDEEEDGENEEVVEADQAENSTAVSSAVLTNSPEKAVSAQDASSDAQAAAASALRTGDTTGEPPVSPEQERLLTALRQNPETGEFWKNLDDRIAHKLLSAMKRLDVETPAQPSELSSGMSPESAPSVQDGIATVIQTELAATSRQGEKRTGRTSGSSPEKEQLASTGDSAERSADVGRLSAAPADETSLRQKFKEARHHEAPANGSNQSTSQGSSTANTLLTPASTSQAVSADEAADLSDLVNRLITRGDGEKQAVHETVTAASQQAVKKVSMAGREASRDFSFTRDPSPSAAAVRAEASQGKSDPVRSALFSQIIEKAEFFKGPQQVKVMTLQLKPEALGKLEMQLATKDGAVTARISAESAAVKDKIEQLVPQIREHLSQQGVNILQISVDVSRKDSDGNERGMADGDGRPGLRIGSKRSSRVSGADEGDSTSSMLINPEIRKMALHIKAVDVTV
ncbi:MAG TPA: flagellar hook-length control protein FliK [Candidatus Ozemobacteraceae bacterium]|nr:flagellar hook-length control protein FliK [Candidatus Ozemobacteraceae bacterium]